MNEQCRPLQTPLPAIPERHHLGFPDDGSVSFVRRKRRANPGAMLVSMLVTAGLLGLILLVSGVADRVRPAVEAMVVVPLKQDPEEDRQPPEEEQPVDQPEVTADSPEEASPASRPQTVAPAPALPNIPTPAIPLVEPLPQTPIMGEAPTVQPGANSNGDQPQGALGFGGQGGDGIAGNGSGGAGNGDGTGNRLFASWAPDMDFSLLNYYYPKSALKARIEGTALLNCYVPRFGLVRECKLLSESPEGYRFGKAALRSRQSFRIRVHNQAGRRVYNEWVKVRAHFILPKLETSEAETEAEAEAQTDAGTKPSE